MPHTLPFSPLTPCRIAGPARSFAPRAVLVRPLALCPVPAGFPSPADDYLDRGLDLNEHLVLHPESTFFLRVRGDSMIGAGIHDNDILIVDRAVDPVSGRVVVAVVNGELTVKRLKSTAQGLALVPENPDYAALAITPDMDFTVWGVVRHVVHSL